MIFKLMVIASPKGRIQSKEGIESLVATHHLFVRKGKANSFKYEEKDFIVNVASDVNIAGEKVFGVECSGDAVEESSFRGVFLSVFERQFQSVYIVWDEVSQRLSADCYPKINRVENLLRHFISRLMILKIGSEWWQINVTDNISNKIASRDGRTPYATLALQDIFNVDFKDLLDFIYSNFSGFKTKNEIQRELAGCESLEDFQNLQSRTLSNWELYFSDLLGVDFRDKWNDLAECRNAIAHNKIIDDVIFNQIQTLSNDLRVAIESAMGKMDGYVISKQEAEAINLRLSDQKNVLVSAAVKRLAEIDIKVDDIVGEIDKMRKAGSQSFNSIDLIRLFNSGEYFVNQPINWAFGRVLSGYASEFGIERQDGLVLTADDGGAATSCRAWTIL